MSTIRENVEKLSEIVGLMNHAKMLWKYGLISEQEMDRALETLNKMLRSYMGIEH